MKKKNIVKSFRRLFLCLLCLAMAAGNLPGAAAAAEDPSRIRCYEAADFLRSEEEQAPQGENIHVLLIGQDRRPGEGGRRSDSMILCSFLPDSGTLVLTSIMRDLYVNIPGHGKNRINAAYAWGGPELLDRTLEENLGIRVEGNIEVDFDQFPKVIDLLGGVTVDVRADEAAEINRLVPDEQASQGLQTLSGAQTLVYSRIRKLDADSDFSRTGRQRKVLGALLSQYQSISLGKALKLLAQLLPMVDTDLNYLQVMTYCRMVLPSLKNLKVVSQRIPAAGHCRDGQVDGMSVLVPDLPAIRRMLRETIGI